MQAYDDRSDVPRVVDAQMVSASEWNLQVLEHVRHASRLGLGVRRKDPLDVAPAAENARHSESLARALARQHRCKIRLATGHRQHCGCVLAVEDISEPDAEILEDDRERRRAIHLILCDRGKLGTESRHLRSLCWLHQGAEFSDPLKGARVQQYARELDDLGPLLLCRVVALARCFEVEHKVVRPVLL